MEVFTITWRLENFSYFWQSEIPVKICSPDFEVFCVVRTYCRLFITDEKPGEFSLRENPKNVKFINIYLQSLKDIVPFTIDKFTEVELLLVDGSLLRPRKLGMESSHSEKLKRCIFKETLSFHRTIAEILPEDVLIVKCKMWTTSVSYLERGECFIRTSAIVENMEVVAKADGVSLLKPDEKVAARVISESSEKASFSVNICRSEFGHFVINIIGKNLAQLGFCRVLILDNVGKWEVFGQDSEWGKHRTACEFVLSRPVDYLLNNKEQYLQNDMITMKCIVAFYCTNETPKRNEKVKHKHVKKWKKCPPNIYTPTLSDDFYSFYKEGVLCDVKLRTDSEVFMAHKIVLSARSPVFKKMFTSDTLENESNFVDNLNMSADILRNLLMFIYTDRTGPLNWQTAVDLYFVARMYAIEALKERCVNFLKINLEPSRCTDLLMSDLYQEADLRQFVLEYIASRGKEVLESDEWKNFKDNHPELVADIMSKIFK